MQITNVTCPSSKYSVKCPYSMTPTGICVHNTANDASAMSEISYMLGNNNKTSFHAAVDDTRIVTGLPFNRNAWHAGDGGSGRGNRTQIAIEICYSKSGGQRFENAENLAAEYIAYLLRQYGWGIDRVSKHQDYSGKYCPHRTLDMGWERFLNKIRAQLGSATTTSSKYGAGSYEVTANTLNVRASATTNSRIVTQIHKGSKQGVDYTSGSWGHLLNNAGWICLDYCKPYTIDRSRAGSYETTSRLNVRAEANTSSRIVTTLPVGSKQAVDYNVGNWGHLQNNAGWICLDYCIPI